MTYFLKISFGGKLNALEKVLNQDSWNKSTVRHCVETTVLKSRKDLIFNSRNHPQVQLYSLKNTCQICNISVFKRDRAFFRASNAQFCK